MWGVRYFYFIILFREVVVVSGAPLASENCLNDSLCTRECGGKARIKKHRTG